jgi:hypothetical protein
MLKRHEVEILLKARHSEAEVARLAGVSLRSVNRIAEEAPVVHADDAAEREKRQIGGPSKVQDFRNLIVKILEEKPDLPSLEILRRVREAGYQGGKTALYALVASVRPKEIKPLIRFEGLPGEFSQHDFGEVDVTFLDGVDSSPPLLPFSPEVLPIDPRQCGRGPDVIQTDVLRSFVLPAVVHRSDGKSVAFWFHKSEERKLLPEILVECLVECDFRE